MERKLIIDVGMHNGDDTYYYLKEGFNVVAIEADPVLCEKGAKRFQQEVNDGRLKILNIGVSDQEGTFPFYVNLTLNQWSSFSPEMGMKKGKYKTLQIKATRFENILKEYGTPFYLKIDIEGFDTYCVAALDPADLPQYLSCEGQEIDVLNQMYALGYRKFKIIDQFYAHRSLNISDAANPLHYWYYFIRFSVLKRIKSFYKIKFPKDSSGPFGEKAFGPWMTYEQVAELYNKFYNSRPGHKPLNPKSWFDFHASL
jgi:FkbM family methyltransferase